MDDKNQIDEGRRWAQNERDMTDARMQQAAEFWSKYDGDTLPPVLQTFKDRAVEYVRALPDTALRNEEKAYWLPPQLEDRAGEVGVTDSLKERLWQHVFAEERDRRGITDPNDYSEPLDAEPVAGAPGGAAPGEGEEARDELTGRAQR